MLGKLFSRSSSTAVKHEIHSPMKNLRITSSIFLFAISFALSAQNVGINYDGSAPNMMLDVKTINAVDGIKINNMAGNGDPILGYELNNLRRITMGVDDSDADKFKIGTTALTTNTRLTLMTTGRFGINTTAPAHLWHMTRGTTNIGASTMALFENNGGTGVALSANATSGANGFNALEGITWYGGTVNTPSGVFGLHIYQNAAVNSPGIGTFGQSNEWQGFGVYGARFNSGGANTGWGGVFISDLGYTGFFGIFSDANLKEDVAVLSNAMFLIKQLNPVTFNYKTDLYPNAGFSEDKQYGFIAQEVAQVIPEAVKVKSLPLNGAAERSPNEALDLQFEDFHALDMTKMIPIMVKALQEQEETISDLQSQIDALTTLIEE